jgi:hypothetical protein
VDAEDDNKDKTPECEVGIRQSLRVRRYTLSDSAREQRKKAATNSRSSNNNGFKHGRYARNFLHKIKPCLSSCAHYPCDLVEEGSTHPGEECLEKAEILSFYKAVREAIVDKKMDAINDLAALQIANSMKVLDMLQEDIMRDGSVVKREKLDKNGNMLVEYVPHPSLLVLPKLVSDLGINLGEYLATPRSKEKQKSDEEGAKSISDLMAQATKAFASASAKKGAPTDE